MAYAEGSPEFLAKEGYDAQAKRYLDWTLSKPSLREQSVRKLLDLLSDPSSATVLELGCGAGIPVTKMLAEGCKSVVANEISSAQIELAREYLVELNNIELKEGSMTELDFPDGEFDAVVAMYSIVHLDPEGQKLIFEKIRRWVKLGGLLLVNLGTEALPGRTAPGWLGMKAAYWSSFGQEENERLIEDSGFKVLSSEISDDAGDARYGWYVAKAVDKKWCP
ncbi:hypothetical protein MMC10_003303 [Thelotrema lepadinum]|nr:hypothetical protein [Thelotrema lepadinum]